MLTNSHISEYISGLKSRDVEIRRKSIRDLYHFARTELREMPQATLTLVLDEFNQHIHVLVASYDSADRKAGILIIACLIGSDTDSTKTRTIRYSEYLKNVFPSSDSGVLELAAKTVGRLANTLGVKRGEYVESEIKTAFEWLIEERNEGKRLSAVYLLKELAIALPSYFYQQINGFFDHIFIALRDPKEHIRETAGKALRAAFMVTSQRENPKQAHKAHWYQQSFEEAMTSFSDLTIRERGLSRDDHVHAGLLILNELFRCSNSAWEKKYTTLMRKLDAERETADDMANIGTKSHNIQTYSDEQVPSPLIYESSFCRQLIKDKYEKICSDVMAQQLSRSHHVHQMLLLMVPRLAAFNREVFAKNHLQSTINHLITFFQGRQEEKAMAFTTLGLIAVAMESDIQQHLNRIIDIIKHSLTSRETPKKRHGTDSALFNCITLLGYSMGEDISDELKDLLDPMCAAGLSFQLTTCFKELSQNIPTLRKDITDRLLNILSLILRKKPYLPPRGSHTAEHLALLAEPNDASKLVLALRTLGTFDFEWQHIFIYFIQRCTDHYMQSDQQDVRLESVRTSSKLLVKAVEKASQSHSRTLLLLIDDSIAKLLSTGLTEFDNDVRFWVFEIFTDPIFDYFLAQEEHLNKLFVAINDENIDLRELAMCIIGRLSSVNPSYVTPTIRQMYVQFLNELQHSGVARNKEQATRMINNLILHAPALTRPYVDTVLNVIVPKLKEEDNSPGVVMSMLKAVGDLADVNGDGSVMNKWLPALAATLVKLLADTGTTETRSVALWCFGQVVSAAGYVITPYSDYPQLMNTLLDIFKSEQQVTDRRETIRVLGILGALDPYKHRLNMGLIDFQTVSILIPVDVEGESAEDKFDSNVSEMLVNTCPLVLDEFYPALAVTALMGVLREPARAQHHSTVVHAVTFIFRSLGIKCVPYIARVVPSLLYVIRTTTNLSFCEFLFAQLAQLIAVVKVHIRNYLMKIFDLIIEFWKPNSQLLPTLILLVEQIAVSLGPEFKIYLPKVLPLILKVLNGDTSKDKFITEKLLQAIQKFEKNMDDVMQVLVPAITRLFDAKDSTPAVSKLAMETIMNLTLFLDFKPFSSRLIHPLARVLESNPSLRPTAMNTLCALVVQLGRDYNDFIPSMEKLLIKHKICCQDYAVLVTRLQFISTLASDDNYMDETRLKLRNRTQDVVATSSETTITKMAVNVHNLRKCWAVNSRLSKDDWMEWLRRLSVGLITESHSPAIRACANLASNYPKLASDLFNAAFMSCWTELDEASRKELVAALEQALTAPDAPELALTVLNLAEFMEHCEKGSLPIATKLLGDRAISCRAYAKAIFYKEEEYRTNPTSQVVEALIHINNKLQQKEAAMGLLQKVMLQREGGDTSLNVHVRWYEKLHNWNQALDLYSKKLETEPQDEESRLGQMRCLEALGEWEKLHNITSDHWDTMSHEAQMQSAKIAAAASWGLQQWDAMRRHVDIVPETTQEGSFYRSILAIHDGEWLQSRHFIDQARSMLETELAAVAGESYQRAYGTLVNAQLLAELEEVVSYKLVEERRNVIRQAWWMRLQGGQKVLEDWRKMLQIRSLVLSPREDFITWLKFASLSRKSGALTQANRVLTTILENDPSTNPDLVLSIHEPRLTLTYTKNLWMSGERRFAYELLQRYVEGAGSGDDDHCRLLARCHLKLGSWCESLQEINDLSIPEILRNYAAATVLAPDWYKAWHAWAYMNFETVLFYKQQDNTSESSLTISSGEKKTTRTEFLHQYVVPAVEGFFKSISLSQGNALQDTLRLLTLWFDYGHHPAIYETLFEGVRKIEINIWLQVIPQLIARIDSPRPLVAKLVHSLLLDIGKFHPQALVYPLTVASKSSYNVRKTAANQILKSMCAHSQNLVTQAAIISEELIRVAIMWHDQWYIGLDEASRLYYSEKDIKGMFKALEPLHAMLERGPQTLKEQSFVQMYARDLREAQDWCNRFKETNNDNYLNQAWDLYYHVFRRIAGQLRSLTSLELQYVSQRLLNCRDLEIAVPGSYAPNQEVIRIAHIHSNLQVIKSKQRPRRLTIHGSDGKDYMFLLKGHEDLRQDERVMQLFGLVNTLLKSDNNTYRHDLAIQRYAVVPLSTNSGLIGWVPHCDTLYNLISDYREKKSSRMALSTEQQIMMRMASDLNRLTLMQKVEVFEHTLSQTPGDDLAKLLWLKSPSAEVWFERRSNYTRSLAVMSMVGYILGLGDRHPSNIMLHRVTGKVLHIDFGDCFEVTLTREKFPEKIPFRLTQMLINAMEVTGIEGTYRNTCEAVMEVLHKNKDSVMAVLEAFVYDPLLNWRLVETGRHSMSETSLCSSDPDSPSTLPSRSRHHLHINESVEAPVELNLNKRALAIINRIKDKLTGRDFPLVEEVVTVPKQVDLLIRQATNNENLCQCYIGWCPYW